MILRRVYLVGLLALAAGFFGSIFALLLRLEHTESTVSLLRSRLEEQQQQQAAMAAAHGGAAPGPPASPQATAAANVPTAGPASAKAPLRRRRREALRALAMNHSVQRTIFPPLPAPRTPAGIARFILDLEEVRACVRAGVHEPR
jgi:hypothetical protein